VGLAFGPADHFTDRGCTPDDCGIFFHCDRR
jgi:hypothetical protein